MKGAVIASHVVLAAVDYFFMVNSSAANCKVHWERFSTSTTMTRVDRYHGKRTCVGFSLADAI